MKGYYGHRKEHRDAARKLHRREMTMADYERKASKVCRKCRHRLGKLMHYSHSEGWKVAGFPNKQWLYRVCTGCGYEWDATYLGCLK